MILRIIDKLIFDKPIDFLYKFIFSKSENKFVKFIDKILSKEYSKTELQSFSSMNFILAFVLFFFAFHGLGFLWTSYDKKPPYRLEEMQILEGKILKLNDKKIGKETDRRLEFIDKNNTKHILYFGTGSNYPFENYVKLIGEDIRIWFPITEPDKKRLQQIQYMENDKYFMKYEYEGRMEYYNYLISDYYRNTYKKWGGGALALLILQITLTKLIKRRYYANSGRNGK